METVHGSVRALESFILIWFFTSRTSAALCGSIQTVLGEKKQKKKLRLVAKICHSAAIALMLFAVLGAIVESFYKASSSFSLCEIQIFKFMSCFAR